MRGPKMLLKVNYMYLYLVLLGSSRPYPWLILEESGHLADDDDDDDDDDNFKMPVFLYFMVDIHFVSNPFPVHISTYLWPS